MQVICPQDQLKRGLSIVGHAVAGKSTLPVLSNVLLATDNGRLRLAATNLEIGITHWISANVVEEGAITVSAKLFTDLINGLPNDQVRLTLDVRTQSVTVTCGRYTSTVKGIEAEEFPEIPTVGDRAPTASVTGAVLREAIDQVAFAASTQDFRPVLTGVLMRIRDGAMILAAADNVRLATRTIPLSEPTNAGLEFIVPAKTLNEVSRIVSNDGVVALTTTPNGTQVMFHTEATEIVSRLIDGKFPDFERIIPSKHTTRSLFDTTELRKAVKLAAIFASSNQNVVKLSFEPNSLGPGKLVISANAAELGDNRGEIDGTISGDGGQITLNAEFLADVLDVVKTPQVAIETQGPQNPGVFKPVGQDGYVHIIMPMSPRS